MPLIAALKLNLLIKSHSCPDFIYFYLSINIVILEIKRWAGGSGLGNNRCADPYEGKLWLDSPWKPGGNVGSGSDRLVL